MSTATNDFGFPSTINSFTYTIGKVKFSFSLGGFPKSSSNDNSQEHLALKSDQTPVHNDFRIYQLELRGYHRESPLLSLW